MKLDNLNHREALAAEYVLGTLRGPARERFEHLLENDEGLRELVNRWEKRLSPLAAAIPPAAPPERLWEKISDQIRHSEPAPAATAQRRQLWTCYQFWRRMTWAVSAVAAALLIYVGVLLLQPPSPDYLAVISDDKAQHTWIVTAMDNHHDLEVRALKAQPIVPGKSLQLWALPVHGPGPISLGLLPTTPGVAVHLRRNLASSQISALAVSLEPAGGSPLPMPTGPILYQAPWIRMPTTKS